MYKTLADEQVAYKIVEHRTIQLPFSASVPVRFRVINLTDYGKSLARALGVELVESDWEKIVRLHKGETQEQHAALVLMAAYQARLRGWKAEVMPFNPQETPWFQPDLKLVDPEGWFYYCEVETRSRDNPEKWMRMRQVNLIVPMPVTRYWMVERLKAMGIPGTSHRFAHAGTAGEGGRFEPLLAGEVVIIQ